MNNTERRASLNIFVNRSDGKVIVSVNNELKELRRMNTAFDTVACNSNGLIGSRILKSIGT
jgi:hypothetical protein